MRVLGGQPNLDDDAFCAMLKLQKPGSKNQVQAQQDRTRQRWINAHRPCRIWGERPHTSSWRAGSACDCGARDAACLVETLAAQAMLPNQGWLGH